MEKVIVRKHIRRILQQMTPENIREKSYFISERLFQTSWWREAHSILAFCSMAEEVDTSSIIQTALNDMKQIGVPRIVEDELVFHCIRTLEEKFSVNEFGIKEPEPSWPILNIAEMNSQNCLILVPGLAFDRKKNRLGRGKGFYDRFLAQVRSCRSVKSVAVGMCFSEQLLENVPVSEHDQSVDGVITEIERIY